MSSSSCVFAIPRGYKFIKSSLLYISGVLVLLGIKRIYDKVELTDGKRVLIDGLWPRGVRKSTSNIDMWFKEVAPSKELRLWFSHDPAKWEGFRKRYMKELGSNNSLNTLIDMIKEEDITLVYATKDEKHNNAIVLAEVIKERIKRG